jgi:RNA polymerase sigma-70 factor, ECF subfamily
MLKAMSELELQAFVEQGDARGATKLIVETYGVEVFGYVTSLLKDEDLASDAFSAACENVFKAVTAFRGQSSVRTWFYTIARHAAFREARQRRRRRGEPISMLEGDLAAPVRTATAAFRKTEVKDKIAQLRESLSAEERELLLLRVDRGLSWNEIAAVCLGAEDAEESALKLEAARCRKQFERAKSKLRNLAEREGLLPPKA